MQHRKAIIGAVHRGLLQREILVSTPRVPGVARGVEIDDPRDRAALGSDRCLLQTREQSVVRIRRGIEQQDPRN